MTPSRIHLEFFETESADGPRETPDYKRGFEDGLAHGETVHAALQQKAMTDIAARLNDMSFGVVEARAQLLEQIRPLLDQIAGTVLPGILQDCFATQMTDALFTYFEDACAGPVQICVAPDCVDDLSVSVKYAGDQFTVIADPNLTNGQATLRQADSHIMIDTVALLAALQNALSGLEPLKRTLSHG